MLHLHGVTALATGQGAHIRRRDDGVEDGVVDATIKVLGLDDFVDGHILADGLIGSEMKGVGLDGLVDGQTVDLDHGRAVASHAILLIDSLE